MKLRKVFGLLLLKIPAALIVVSVLWVLLYKYVQVPYTPLMLKRSIQFSGQDSEFCTRHDWVPLENISANMVKAVIATEDNRFAQHNGFDIEEIRKMLDEHQDKGKPIRGCSTISQQTAKNCFTFCSDTWIRKGFEAWYTFLIEKIWGKRRIMEVYLNVVELGKGIYGVETASQVWYGKNAARLTQVQSIKLAVCLPNPLKRSPEWVERHYHSRIGQIQTLIPKIQYPDWVHSAQR